MLGKFYKLICKADAAILDLQWLSQDGLQIVESHTLRIGNIMRVNGKSSLTLYFKPLTSKNVGKYLCRSEVASTTVKFNIQSEIIIYT